MQNTCIMPTLQIRDLPQDIYDNLVALAEENRRSLTQEAIILLQKSIESTKSSKERAELKQENLNKFKEIRKGLPVMTDEDIVDLIREDRDR